MRNRDIALMGAGAAGAFLLAVGAITSAAPPAPGGETAVLQAPARPEVAQADIDGWVVQRAAPAAGAEPAAANASEAAEAAGEAGVWSKPAEFAPPD